MVLDPSFMHALLYLQISVGSFINILLGEVSCLILGDFCLYILGSGFYLVSLAEMSILFIFSGNLMEFPIWHFFSHSFSYYFGFTPVFCFVLFLFYCTVLGFKWDKGMGKKMSDRKFHQISRKYKKDGHFSQWN